MKKYFLLFVLFCSSLHSVAQPIAFRGEIDFRRYNFNEQFEKLDGEWAFYENQLYLSEDFNSGNTEDPVFVDFLTKWNTEEGNASILDPNFGYGTYRLLLKTDEKHEALAVYVPHFYCAYAMFVNGVGFSSNGKVGRSEAESQPYWRPSVKDLNLKPGQNEIIIHVSNFSHYKGGVNKSILIGTPEVISARRNFGIGSSFFLGGCLLISAVLGLAMFWFNRRDFSALFFFLFCFSNFYRAIGTDEYVLHSAWSSLPWELTLRLEYISLFASVVFYVWFVKYLISFKIPSFVLYLVTIVSTLAAISTVLPSEIFTAFMTPYLFFISAGMVFLAINAAVRMNFSHKMSWLTVTGALVLAVVVFSKIGAYLKFLPESVWIDFVGYILFIFTQTIALSIRFGRNLRESNYAAGAATKSRAEFLNTMSHELRTPMNAILGMSEFLSKTKLDSTQKEKVETIQKNGESLLAIILDILSISELESGKIKLEKRPLNVEECIRGAVNLAVKEKGVKPIDLIIKIDPEIPDRLIGDATRIKQIFMNLVSNAFKFTEKGSVRIEGSLKDSSGEEIELSFRVIDTGIGMAASKMKGLFSAFKQADSTNTRKYGGTGLGLSVVRELLAHMNGSLNMQSQKGKGTTALLTFKLGMPKITTGTTSLPSSQENNTVDTSLKILYAEDNPVNQKLMVMMLKTFGLDIDVAENGNVAWHKALENSYHMILMDLQMPEMDGFEATKRIVNDVRSRPVIIAVTANASSSDKRKCFEAGMNDFISKPIKADVLKDAIIKWQGMRKYLDDGSEDRSKIFDISA